MAGNDNILFYMAIGDAYGMAWEFVDDMAKTGPNDLTYKANPRYAAYRKGHYTDDTQMSIASAETMLSGIFNESAFADAWVAAYKRDPRPGYGRRMQDILPRCADGDDFRKQVDPRFGTTSGACMRAGVIGLLPYITEVMRVAKMQARITHDTETGILSAQAAALSVHYMHYNLGPKRGLPAFLDSHLGAWRDRIDAKDPKNGLTIFSRALKSVMAADTLSGILKHGVDYGPGQDTDTLCALAMVIAPRCREIRDDLPARLLDGLENGPYGRDYLKNLDSALLKRFPAP